MFTVLSIPGCMFCTKTQEVLKAAGHAYVTHEHESMTDLHAALDVLVPGISRFAHTHPQIVVETEPGAAYLYVGSYEHLLDYLDEPILRYNPLSCASPYPIVFRDMWDHYKRTLLTFWTVAEGAEISVPVHDDEARLFKHALVYFATADAAVAESVAAMLLADPSDSLGEAIHCVSADTMVLTRGGHHSIASLHNQRVEVWNGSRFAAASVCKTGTTFLTRVTLSNGLFLDCTDDHQWYVTRTPNPVKTIELLPGDELRPFTLPIVQLADPGGELDESTVPFLRGEAAKFEWLERFFDKYALENSETRMHLSHPRHDMLHAVQVLLTTMGVHSVLKGSDLTSTPEDSTKLTVDGLDLLDGRHDTFCFDEPEAHKGTFNAIVTGQSRQNGLLIEAVIEDAAERVRLCESVREAPGVQQKAEWARKWLAPSRRYGERLVAFVCGETIMRTGPFCALREVLPGLDTHIGIHKTFGESLYAHLKKPLPYHRLLEIVQEAVDIEKECVAGAFLHATSCNLVKQYVEYVADCVLGTLGHPKVYLSTNPFPAHPAVPSVSSTVCTRAYAEYTRVGALQGAAPVETF